MVQGGKCIKGDQVLDDSSGRDPTSGMGRFRLQGIGNQLSGGTFRPKQLILLIIHNFWGSIRRYGGFEEGRDSLLPSRGHFGGAGGVASAATAAAGPA